MTDRETCMAATDRIFEQVEAARAAVAATPLVTDGHGVLRDPSPVRASLRDARAAIDAANPRSLRVSAAASALIQTKRSAATRTAG